MKQSMQVLVSHETTEWYTPPEWIERCRRVLGRIDLDPASHPVCQTWIQAEKYYTEKDDGLSKTWSGRIFCNPPYGKTGSKSNQHIWGQYLVDEIRIGNVIEAILLTKTVPGYQWWDDMFNGLWPGPVCITRGRIPFVRPTDVLLSPGGAVDLGAYDPRKLSKAASSFWYYGPHTYAFRREFQTVGRVIDPK